MNITAVIGAAALVAGFGAAWMIQGWRWDEDIAQLRLEQNTQLMATWAEGERKAEQAEQQKEKIQNEYLAFRNEESKRNTAISNGAQRVYVRASCPSVPSSSPSSSGAKAGAAELDPAYRQALSDLRSGAAEQLRLLNVCRAELIGR